MKRATTARTRIIGAAFSVITAAWTSASYAQEPAPPPPPPPVDSAPQTAPAQPPAPMPPPPVVEQTPPPEPPPQAEPSDLDVQNPARGHRLRGRQPDTGRPQHGGSHRPCRRRSRLVQRDDGHRPGARLRVGRRLERDAGHEHGQGQRLRFRVPGRRADRAGEPPARQLPGDPVRHHRVRWHQDGHGARRDDIQRFARRRRRARGLRAVLRLHRNPAAVAERHRRSAVLDPPRQHGEQRPDHQRYELGYSTTVQNSPWDIFAGNVAARYYF